MNKTRSSNHATRHLASAMAVAAASIAATALPASAALDAHSYVQRGLAACYDGIDNTGTGTHDSSTKIWKDLTGNGNDASMDTAHVIWNGADGWTASTNCKPFTVASPGLAPTFATTNFTVQFACRPAVADKRICYFGQYDTDGGISIEHTVSGQLRIFRKRGLGGVTTDYSNNESTGSVKDNQFLAASMNVYSGHTIFYVGGNLSIDIAKDIGAITASSDSIIGGEVQDGSKRTSLDSTYGITFRGTYNAFRVYNRILTADEVKVNAAIDAVRFGGVAPSSASLPSGWAFAGDGTLMVTVSATAGDGGLVSAGGGAAAASVSATVDHDGSRVVAFAAVPDAGYVFDRWTGDTDYIASGSFLTPTVTVNPDRAVTLVANFRRNGDAADGLKFDIDFTGNASADGVTFSATSAGEAQGYVTADIPLPVLPTVTNANVSCIYLPQPTNTAAGVFRQDARVAGAAVTGQVATVFVRFRWDGSVLPDVVNYPAIVMNGYTSWSLHPREGFCLRLRADKNATRGNFSLIVPGLVVPYNSAGITTTGIAYVNAGQWVDAFVSVYPSPTDPALSNADVWYRQVPTWFDDDGNFGESQPGHRHFGDGCAIPRMDTATQRTIIFGSEPNAAADAITGDNAVKVFRGAIAAARGWNRLLSENEMWTVMAEFGGVQSFTDLETNAGRTFETGTLTTLQGRNGTPTAFVGDADTSHFWRALSTTYPSLALLWDAPKDADSMPVIYRTSVKSIKSGLAQPIHLECNGATVWSAADVATGDEIRVEIGAEHTLPGLNELRWVYDTGETSNWVQFKNHWLRLVTPDKPFTMVIR